MIILTKTPSAGLYRNLLIAHGTGRPGFRKSMICWMKMSLKPIKKLARDVLEQASAQLPKHREALALSKMEKTTPIQPVEPQQQHLQEAISWIKRAQLATGDGGVSWGYRARAAIRTTDRLGWVPAYPETTGYIIPTMLRYARLTGDLSATQAALRMVDWELRIQLPDGGIQGGIYGDKPVSSSTFVTGQVLFGLVAAMEQWNEPRHKEAAIRAGDFLLDCLDSTGRFAKGYSHFCEAGPKAYEVRTGLALAQLGLVLGSKKYLDAASLMADYALSCQHNNGWFQENDLNMHDKPLTHTIGYVLEGLHGIGELLNRQDCLEAVNRTLHQITQLPSPDGMLPGRWFSDWTPAVTYACLTGSAQLAGVLLRFQRQHSDAAQVKTASQLLGFLCWTQERKIDSEGLTGGIRGSYPFSGDYGKWCVLNWATKFFVDSLMDYQFIQANSKKQHREDIP